MSLQLISRRMVLFPAHCTPIVTYSVPGAFCDADFSSISFAIFFLSFWLRFASCREIALLCVQQKDAHGRERITNTCLAAAKTQFGAGSAKLSFSYFITGLCLTNEGIGYGFSEAIKAGQEYKVQGRRNKESPMIKNLSWHTPPLRKKLSVLLVWHQSLEFFDDPVVQGMMKEMDSFRTCTRLAIPFCMSSLYCGSNHRRESRLNLTRKK